jgi:hypothetical protein
VSVPLADPAALAGATPRGTSSDGGTGRGAGVRPGDGVHVQPLLAAGDAGASGSQQHVDATAPQPASARAASEPSGAGVAPAGEPRTARQTRTATRRVRAGMGMSLAPLSAPPSSRLERMRPTGPSSGAQRLAPGLAPGLGSPPASP